MIVDSDKALLRVEDLVTHYPIPRGIVGAVTRRPKLRVHAVDGVSFTLNAGEMLALVGESGSGKTTTAQTIIRMVDPKGGRVWFKGQDITHLRESRLRPLRAEIQLIYQDPYESLDPRFRVRETVEEPLLVHGRAGSDVDRRKAVLHALARAGLSPPEVFVERYPHELSGGQRQRVAIAAALVLNPALLVADEPVSMLDVSVRAGILDVLAGLRREGLGILMITHDLSTAAHYADRIAVMYLGRIVELGPARQVVRDPRHPYTRALISVVPSRDPLTTTRPQLLEGETPNPTYIPTGCRFHPRCPVLASGRSAELGVDDLCRNQDLGLEEVEVAHSAACHAAIRASALT